MQFYFIIFLLTHIPNNATADTNTNNITTTGALSDVTGDLSLIVVAEPVGRSPLAIITGSSSSSVSSSSYSETVTL